MQHTHGKSLQCAQCVAVPHSCRDVVKQYGSSACEDACCFKEFSVDQSITTPPASKTPRHSLAAKTTCGANLVRPRRPWSRHLSDETEAHRILLVRQAAEMLFHLIDLDEAGKLQGTWLGRCFPIVYPILGTSSLSFPYSASYTEPG